MALGTDSEADGAANLLKGSDAQPQGRATDPGEKLELRFGLFFFWA